MKWIKGKIDDNDGKPMDCWRSEDGNYIISQNIFGLSDWLYETCKFEPGLSGREKFIGEAKTLKAAKTIGDEHAAKAD